MAQQFVKVGIRLGRFAGADATAGHRKIDLMNAPGYSSAIDCQKAGG